MSRILFGLLGGVLALFPDDVLEAYERFALESPDKHALKPWVRPGMQLEGLVYAAVGLTGGRAYAWLMNLVGAVGAIVVAFPRQYLAFGARFAYEDGETVEWRDEFVTVVRGLGACFVLLAVRAARKRADE